MKRRNFLRLLGLFGSAMLPGCRKGDQRGTLISHLVPPDEGVLPGEARWLPSTCHECPAHCGLLVRLRDGRPVKLEGHPEHPLSRGGLCMRGQAGLERLYHPQRILRPRRRLESGWRDMDWAEAFALIDAALREQRQADRQTLLLTGRTTGSLADLITDFCRHNRVEQLPEFELYNHAALRKANALLFGQAELPQWRIQDSDLLLTLGADILETFVHPVDLAGQVAQARHRGPFSWWHAEPHLSLTGAHADHHLQLRPAEESALLRYLLAELAQHDPWSRRLPPQIREQLGSPDLQAAAAKAGVEATRLVDLRSALHKAQRPLVMAGGIGTAHPGGLEVALLAGLLQWLLDPEGRQLNFFRRQNYQRLGTQQDMGDLARRLDNQEVGVLFISRTNPVYNTSDSVAFLRALGGASLTVVLADMEDETTAAADVVLPLTHPLESWGDAEPVQGIWSVAQPLIAPRGQARSEGDILIELWRHMQGESPPPADSYQEFLYEAWEQRWKPEQLAQWSHGGWLEDPVTGEAAPALQASQLLEALNSLARDTPGAAPNLLLTPSLRTFDGRGRPLRLLSEIPDPLTTISWGSWIALSETDARSWGLKQQEVAQLDLNNRHHSLPIKIQPGLAPGILVAARDAFGSLPFAIDKHSGDLLAYASVAAPRRHGRTHLPILAGSTSQHGRGIIPDPAHLKAAPSATRSELYPEHDHTYYSWAMVIDLNRCNGCSACVAACYIENNVPVVGARDHLKGREMSWLRIEPYYDRGRPEFLPMLCQHCHYAPCEPVCPVYAAYHNPEGLNVQVYQRCVGTRYCSHNCPYKVRRFNWWEHRRDAPLDQMVNPDLVTRERGIMEKCTFCIQRIRSARDRAKDENRLIADGEVIPACAQSCPTRAITFGNLRDPSSRVAQLVDAHDTRQVFAELGTQPSVYYLGRRRNA